MLELTVKGRELFDEINGIFIYTRDQTIKLEHSLVSLSKWESKWKKPFLTKNEKTDEEIIDYLRCMTITQNVDPMMYKMLTAEDIRKVVEYIDDPMTATRITSHASGRVKDRILTSELIYCYMIQLGIPFECQKWHLNRLIKLIEVCSIEGQPGKKMSRNDVFSQNRSLNAARRAAMHSKG